VPKAVTHRSCADLRTLAGCPARAIPHNQVDIEHSPWTLDTRRAGPPSLSVWRLLTWQAPQGLIAFVAMAAILAAMVGGYVRSLPALQVAVDGQFRVVRTNQTLVASVLRDAGVKLYPEDRVVPPLDATVEEGEVIRVNHARPVVVEVDGQAIHTRSLRSAPADILADLGITLSPYDKLVVDGQLVAATPSRANSPLAMVSLSNRTGRDVTSAVPSTIHVQRAVALTVQPTGDQPVTLHTTMPTVGEALREGGFTLYLADTVHPDLGTPVQDGQVVTIDRAVPVTVVADGRHLHTRTHCKTVADTLAEVQVSLEGLDYTNPAPNAPLTPDMTIRVVRVSEMFRIEQEPIPFEIQFLPDPEMEIDTQGLKQAGENGVLQKRIRVRYEDGQEVSSQLEDSGVVREPKHKILAYGTNIVIRTLDTPNGPIEYWRKIRMLATSYSASTSGTPKTASYYGRTRLGWQMGFGIVAVDPTVIQLGSQVYVPGYGIGNAGDTGSAIQKRRIDLGYDDGDPKVWSWYRWTDVYLLTPVPSNIQYVIPEWPPEP
jgi:uncharacterized protein YabE (DUF348 family)